MINLIRKDFLPLVSVVMPVFNGANYLREAVDSALAQTYKNIEIIIINDGSTDDTEKIAKSYGNKIRYFTKENGGVSSALNVGLREMKGEYFSWLSHDDAYYPEKIEKQLAVVTKLGCEKVVLYSDYEFMDENSEVFKTMRLDHEMLEKKPEYALLRSSINGNTLLISRKAFDECGEFDENLKCTQDYDMWSRMMKVCIFVHVPEILAKYRVHEMQDTNKNPDFAVEGDVLWIKMMKSLSLDEILKLEGTEFNFYHEMLKYLNGTPFKGASKFVHEKIDELILDQKNKCNITVSFVSHSAELGGAERALLDIIDAVASEGVFVHVVIPGHGPIEHEFSKRNVFYEIVELPWWANIGDCSVQEIQKSIKESALMLALKLAIVNPDLIFTSTSVISAGAIAAKMLDIPHIWNISEFGVADHGVKYMLNEMDRMKFIDSHSDKVFFVSDALRKYYADKITENKIAVVPNLVRIFEETERELFFHLDGALKISIVGNVIMGKGQKDAVLALRELLERGNDVELIMAGTIGNQSYFDELQNIIEKGQIQDNITFVGCIENATTLIAQSDLVLVCSTNEGFGRVTAEGMLLKKPVIAANSGASVELVFDNENGFLYSPGDYIELADKIEYFIKHNEEIEKMGESGYALAKKIFNNVEYSKKIIKEFMDLKKEKGNADISKEMIEETINSIEKQKNEIMEKQDRIEVLQRELETMKTSKFWKLRNSYICFKNLFKKQ